MLEPKVVVKALAEPVADLLVAKTFAEVERERVDKIQRAVLAENDFQYGELSDLTGKVTDPKYAYLMRDEDSAKYFEILKQIHLAEGFEDAAKGFCPALVAEHEQTKAEWALIEAARQFFPDVDNNALLAHGGCATRKKYLDLIVGLVLAGSKK